MKIKLYRAYSIFTIRIFLGSVFTIAAVGKLSNSEAFIQRVNSYSTNLHGVTSLLPYVELFVGLTIMLGLCLKSGALASIMLSLMFLATHLMDLFREEYANCGCFGEILEINRALSVTIDLAILISGIILYSLLSDVSSS